MRLWERELGCVCLPVCLLSVLTSENAAMVVLTSPRTESSPSPPTDTLHQMFSFSAFHYVVCLTSPCIYPCPPLNFSFCFHFPGCLWISNSHVSCLPPVGLSLPRLDVETVIIGWCTDSPTMSLNHHEDFCLLENKGEYFVLTWLNFPSLCLPSVGDLCMSVHEFTPASVLLTADHSGRRVQTKPKLSVLMYFVDALEFKFYSPDWLTNVHTFWLITVASASAVLCVVC